MTLSVMTLKNDTRHNAIQPNDMHHNDTQHNAI
jgi:hypothetical protein